MPDGGFLDIGKFYSSDDCLTRYLCEKNRQFKEIKMGGCTAKAKCMTKNGYRACHCNKGWTGNGYTTCTGRKRNHKI